jgi:tryptophan-rich sensory protein
MMHGPENVSLNNVYTNFVINYASVIILPHSDFYMAILIPYILWSYSVTLLITTRFIHYCLYIRSHIN